MSKPIVSIVLGTYNRLTFLKLTIQNVRDELSRFGLPAEIIVIDGGSSDGTIKWLTKQKDIISIIQHNRGMWRRKAIEKRPWGYFMNLGFKCAQGKYILMISDDCLIVPDSIRHGYELFENKLQQKERVGALAFYYRNIPFFRKDWTKPGTYFINTVWDKMYVNHGLYLKESLAHVDYIDEKTYAFYCADVDLSFKLQQARYACLPAPDSYIEHYPHANMKLRVSNESPSHKDLVALQNKWGIPTSDTLFSSIQKEYLDLHKTVKCFTSVHLTNVALWKQVIKESLYKRIGRTQ